jgi:hypothetical protein
MVTQRKRAALTEEYSHTLKRYESRSTDKNTVPQGLPEKKTNDFGTRAALDGI